MLGHAKMLFEQGHVSISSKHDKLIASLRTAVEKLFNNVPLLANELSLPLKPCRKF
jgi:hypothetical protein